jgi:hypothetical protein
MVRKDDDSKRKKKEEQEEAALNREPRALSPPTEQLRLFVPNTDKKNMLDILHPFSKKTLHHAQCSELYAAPMKSVSSFPLLHSFFSSLFSLASLLSFTPSFSLFPVSFLSFFYMFFFIFSSFCFLLRRYDSDQVFQINPSYFEDETLLDLTSCSLVYRYQCTKGIHCLHHQGNSYFKTVKMKEAG